ncbi:MAG TPA: hypothetical protein VFQ85_08185 [Mycobacteriales bacterium]|nr:hypothetical protein [Mycobacteriales bacterium]
MTENPQTVVLSLGAGVQSSTLLLLAVEGVLPKPDLAVFADTGWEPRVVYDHLARLTAVAAEAGIPVERVSSGNLRDDLLHAERRFASIPYYVRNPDGSQGMARRQCTSEYKVKPIKARVRELLGYPHPQPVPRWVFAEQWVGFSTDEVHRVDGGKHTPRYLRSRYPLLELGMSRRDCERWLRARGWAATKSACIGCPYHGNAVWRRLRDNSPAEWAEAVAFDEAIRAGGARAHPLKGEAFLHRSCVPLGIAPIDHVTSNEWRERQVDLRDLLAEDGDPDGCSPFGCRSGSPVNGSRPALESSGERPGGTS